MNVCGVLKVQLAPSHVLWALPHLHLGILLLLQAAALVVLVRHLDVLPLDTGMGELSVTVTVSAVWVEEVLFNTSRLCSGTSPHTSIPPYWLLLY